MHPLFLLVGVWHCFTGQLPLFLMSATVALMHETAHAYAAQKIGYELNKIVLMPYGAALDLDFRDISVRDEIAVAIAGPLCNFICAALFLGLWWCFPLTYAYTDTAFYASLSVGLVNLLPAYPLDGGRILRCVLKRKLLERHTPQTAEKRAGLICRLVSIVISVLLVLLSVLAFMRGMNAVTVLVFALFLAVGAFPRKRTEEIAYEKLDFSLSDAISRGVVVKRVAVTGACTVKRALTFLSRGEYLVLDVYDEREKFVGEITQNELSKAFLRADLYTPLSEIL